MRSAVLSFTIVAAFAVTPAMAQMQPSYAPPPGVAPPGVPIQPVPIQGSVPPPATGEMHAPPSHQPMSLSATNLNSQTTRSVISPSLPQPPVGPNADATRYLEAAQSALSRNQTGEAQAALENAETFLLNRSVPMGTVNNPDQSPAVGNINSALQALAANDRGRTMDLIQQTIAMTRQYGMRGGMHEGMNNYPGANPYPGSAAAYNGPPR